MSLLAERILRAVGRRLNLHSGTLVPEACVNFRTGKVTHWTGGEWHQEKTYLADLMWVTDAGYATEFEIKISRADWRADAQKDKWGKFPAWVARFIYAVPAELGVPEWVRPEAGIWHYKQTTRGWHGEIEVVRAPKRIGKQTVPDDELARWMRHLYHRFWYQKLYRDHRIPRLERQPEAEAA